MNTELRKPESFIMSWDIIPGPCSKGIYYLHLGIDSRKKCQSVTCSQDVEKCDRPKNNYAP